jgi:XRE family aerobic/anaerobic benzoate catabolism transcriptional regulator
LGARYPGSSGRESAGSVAAKDAAFLNLLGERVRDARARRGLTRKDLAHHSQVSERYLAQLEAGHGNISVLLLRQIAAALGLALNDLIDEEEQSVELTLIHQLLQRLPKQRLARIRTPKAIGSHG